MVESKSNDLAKRLQREYLRAWRRRNRSKVREYNVRYWQRKAEKRMGDTVTGEGGQKNEK